MEDNEDFMSIFSSDQELNFSYDEYENEDEISEEEKENDLEETKSTNKDKETTDEDDESQEGVGSEDDEDEGDKSNEASPNLYSSIATALHEQGILPSLDSSKEIKSIDDFVEQFNVEIEKQSDLKIQNYLNNLDLEKIAISKKENLELDSINEDYLKNNIEVAKEIIYKDYLNQGLSEDRAKKLLKKTIDLGEDVLIEESLESIDSLKQYNQKIQEQELVNAQKRVEQLQKEQIENQNKIKNFVFNSKEIVQGVNNTKALQEKVYKSILEPVAKDPETGEMMNKFMHERSKNPIEFDIKMYYLYELTNGFKDINNISKTTKSKAIKELENTLRTTKFEDNGLPGYLEDPDSYSGFGSELVL